MATIITVVVNPSVYAALFTTEARIPAGTSNSDICRSQGEISSCDSDFTRVRVRGLPPAADELQFIDRSRILEAQKREAQSLDDDPLICGVDVSGGGAAWNVIAHRRGTDARSIPRIRIPGEHTRDRSVLVGKLAEILRDTRPSRKVTAMFIDMAFGSPIYERLRALDFLGIFHRPVHGRAGLARFISGHNSSGLCSIDSVAPSP